MTSVVLESKLMPPLGGLEMTDRPDQSGSTAGHRQVADAVSAIQAGKDVDANFRFLFDRFYLPLRHFFVRRGFSADEALDLTQETFLGIYTGMKSFRHEGPFAAWLYILAGNVGRKRRRSQAAAMRTGREVPTEDRGLEEVPDHMGQSPLEEAIEEDRRMALRRAIAELPDQARRCMTLRVYQELPYEDIAVVMRLKIDTVKAHLFQAREKIKQRLRGFAFDRIDT